MRDLGSLVMEQNLGKVPINPKKVIETSLGKITLSNSHPIACHESGFKMSPFLLEKVGYVEQLNVYEKSSEILASLLGYKASSVQVNKVVKAWVNRQK